ncbi:hypothetical protein BC830DRAFT_638552 [Chytriomyces sp. MP71]|nr:hypothetical protein BC830DRAFT_638552 [Chytriomyces sp. MP71]
MLSLPRILSNDSSPEQSSRNVHRQVSSIPLSTSCESRAKNQLKRVQGGSESRRQPEKKPIKFVPAICLVTEMRNRRRTSTARRSISQRSRQASISHGYQSDGKGTARSSVTTPSPRFASTRHSVAERTTSRAASGSQAFSEHNDSFKTSKAFSTVHIEFMRAPSAIESSAPPMNLLQTRAHELSGSMSLFGSTDDFGSLRRSASMRRSRTSMRAHLGSTFLTDVDPDKKVHGEAFLRLRRIFRTVALASHFTKYLSKILKSPVQWGWEYDPDANFEKTVAVVSNPEKRERVTAVDFSVGHLFSKNNFQGWLTENMRELFRKPPNLRTDLDVSEMHVWCKTMKAFKKFPIATQKEFLRVGWYERWHSGRTVVRENQKGMYFYILLDGEVEIFKTERERLKSVGTLSRIASRAASRASLVENQNSDENAINQVDSNERRYRVHLGAQSSGESFGELALTQAGNRTSSASTIKTTEFFIIDKDDYLRIMKNSNMPDSSGRINFAASIPIFSTLSVPHQIVSIYTEFVTFTKGSVVIAEGDPCENLYFLKSGKCRVIKSVPFLKHDMPNKTYRLEPFPSGCLSLSAPNQNANSMTTDTKFLVLQELLPTSFYFDGTELLHESDKETHMASRRHVEDVEWWGRGCLWIKEGG